MAVYTRYLMTLLAFMFLNLKVNARYSRAPVLISTSTCKVNPKLSLYLR